MTFLNPLILLGLLAAAIPVLLHLLSLRKLRTIEFSTLRFIKELQRTRLRRLKLRQLLLLILRTLVILLVVLAFARPAVRGSLAPGISTEARTTAILLFDDSYSMNTTDVHGTFLKQAKESAERMLEVFNDGDEVFVFPLSQAVALQDGNPPTSNGPREAAAIIANIDPSPLHRPLGDGLRAAARLLSESKHLNNEVYIVSDFQEGLFREPKNRELLFNPSARFFALPIGEREASNLSVETLSIPDAILEPGKPFVLRAGLRNHGRIPLENHLVSVFVNGTRVSQRGISIGAGESLQVEFSIVPKESGYLPGFVELEDDDLVFDNRRYFSLHLPRTIRVLMVGKQEDTRFLSTAFATREERGSVLSVVRVNPDRLTSSDISQADVVVVSDAGALTSLQAEALQRSVSGGGGLIVFPGPATQPAGFAAVQERLSLPRLLALESPGAGTSAFVEVDYAELDHPLFQGMFREGEGKSKSDRRRSLETPRIRAYARFEPTTSAVPLMTLSGGAAFLLEQRIGAGRVLLFSVTADLTFSDFPLKGLFVPLIHRSVAYAVQEQVRQPMVVSGEEVLLTGIPVPRATMVTPRGFALPLILRQGAVRVAETKEPGIYALNTGSSVIRSFSVNPDPAESHTRRADISRLFDALQQLGVRSEAIRVIREPGIIRDTVMETRHGVELWKQLLLAALILAIAEAFIARENRESLARFTMEAA